MTNCDCTSLEMNALHVKLATFLVLIPLCLAKGEGVQIGTDRQIDKDRQRERERKRGKEREIERVERFFFDNFPTGFLNK